MAADLQEAYSECVKFYPFRYCIPHDHTIPCAYPSTPSIACPLSPNRFLDLPSILEPKFYPINHRWFGSDHGGLDTNQRRVASARIPSELQLGSERFSESIHFKAGSEMTLMRFLPKKRKKTACMLVLSENFHVHACIKIFKTRQQKENNQQNKETNSPLHQSFLGVPLDVLNQGPAPIASKTFWRKTVLANVVPGRKKKRRRCIVTANILTTTSYQRVWHIETSSTVLLNFSWCKTRKRVPTVLSDRILFFTIDLIAPGCFRRAMKVIRTADALRNAYSESKKRIQPDKWF